jgi:hypothetical protein
MSVPVWVEQQNGKFTATVLGAPDIRAEGATKDAAVAEVRARLAERSAAGELVFIEVEPMGVLALAGKYKDDPDWHAMWDQIKSEAYRYRDELKAQEFPE